MALYRLVSVKFSRRVHKKDEDGNLMYRDEDKKSPVYEMKSYDIGQTVDLSAFEAKRLKNDIQPIGGSVDQPTALQFAPDEDGDDDNGVDPEIAKVLAGNTEGVLAYINDHADDEDALEALRVSEQAGKKRKGVLDAVDELLGE